MTEFTPLAGTIGGILVGLSAVLLMLGAGRIAGLSGIFGGLFSVAWDGEWSWRATFIAGLLAGTALAAALSGLDPATFTFAGGTPLLVAGGLLVGTGTALGSGCTSGHGICGLSRLSARSIAATLIFMAAAAATVYVIRHLMGN